MGVLLDVGFLIALKGRSPLWLIDFSTRLTCIRLKSRIVFHLNSDTNIAFSYKTFTYMMSTVSKGFGYCKTGRLVYPDDQINCLIA